MVTDGGSCCGQGGHWGIAYVYASPGDVNREGYDLLSLGADGRRGGEGEDADITSW